MNDQLIPVHGGLSLPGLRVEAHRNGARVTGSVIIDKPNPKGRTSCGINMVLRSNWSAQDAASALRVAAHWFAVIGGLAAIRNAHLCHIVARIRDGYEEKQMHDAIDAYAASNWHRTQKAWTRIERFFDAGFIDQWMDNGLALAASRKAQVKADAGRERRAAEQRDQQERIEAERAATWAALDAMPDAEVTRLKQEVMMTVDPFIAKQWRTADPRETYSLAAEIVKHSRARASDPNRDNNGVDA